MSDELETVDFGEQKAKTLKPTPKPEPKVAPKPHKAPPSPRPQNTPDDGVRVQPHNIEAEEGLIACCLLDGGETILNECIEANFAPKYFYKTVHQSIFEALLELHGDVDSIDEIVLFDHLTSKGRIEEVGGISAIYAIQDRTQTSLHARHYLRIVRDTYIARATIRKNREAIEKLFNAEDAFDVLAEQAKDLEGLSQGFESASSAEEIRGISSFTMVKDDDEMVLLGKKYVNRGHISALVSSSGMGKSSITIQEAICYALGREFQGIKPTRPLKSLIIQSEDDDADIAEVVISIYYKLELTEDEMKQANANVRIVTDITSRGERFFAKLRRRTRLFEPDLVYLNPLLAFFDGDITSSRDCATFFREGLGRINHPDKTKQWAYILVHHTNKPVTANNGKGRPEAKWNEIMYGMSGSSDIINVCRSVRILHPTETEGEFVMHLAKRGKRAGVKEMPRKSDGSVDEMARMVSSTRIYLKHCSDRFTPEGYDKEMACIFWESREPNLDDIPGHKAKKTGRKKIELTMEDVSRVVSRDPEEGKSIRQIINLIKETAACDASERTIRTRLGELIEMGDLRYNTKGKIYASGAVPSESLNK